MNKLVCAITILLVPLLAQANEDAVVRLNGCSGVCVSSDGLILTADHCGKDGTISVQFMDGSTYKAVLNYLPPQNGIDEAQSYQIKGASNLPFARVASDEPSVSDPAWSVGFPAGNYQKNKGLISRVGFTTATSGRFPVNLKHGLVTDWGSDGGNSGGPLFNDQDEVVGLLSMSGDDATSYWIGLPSIHEAIGASKQVTSDVITAYRRQEVVVFTTNDCPPCARLKHDIAAGKFPGHTFKIVNYNQELRTWSDPDLAHEFAKTASAPAGLGFPVTWVRGTDKYRVGYEPDRRGGLLGWLASVFDSIGRAIVGEKTPPKFPPLDASDPPEPPAEEPAPAPKVESALESVGKLKADLLKMKDDVGKLQSANPLTKLKGVVALKSDVAGIKEDAANALSEIRSVKDDTKEKPLQYLWGLFGIISGLIHRRFAS